MKLDRTKLKKATNIDYLYGDAFVMTKKGRLSPKGYYSFHFSAPTDATLYWLVCEGAGSYLIPKEQIGERKSLRIFKGSELYSNYLVEY